MVIICPWDLDTDPSCLEDYITQVSIDCAPRKKVCGRRDIEKLPTCRWNRKTYYEGEEVSKDFQTCKTCLCNQDLRDSDPFAVENKACRKIDCQTELYSQNYLRNGCVPVYLDFSCCPTEYKCRKWSAVIFVPNVFIIIFFSIDLLATAEELKGPEIQLPQVLENNTYCTFGANTYQPYETFKLDDNCLNCQCLVPPMPYCYKNSFCMEMTRKNGGDHLQWNPNLVFIILLSSFVSMFLK